MKQILTATLLLISTGIIASDTIPKFSAFFNLGQSIPIGAYKSNNQPNSSLEIAQSDNFAKSFNLGANYLLRPNLGLCIGISQASFKLDKGSFEKHHSSSNSQSESYLRDHYNLRFYFGAFTQLSIQELHFNPGLNLGISAMNFSYSDYYELDPNNNIYKTISYQYTTPVYLSFNSSLITTYDVFSYKEIVYAIQLHTEISFQNPEVTYDKIESNQQSGTMSKSTKSERQNVVFGYYGVGIVLKF